MNVDWAEQSEISIKNAFRIVILLKFNKRINRVELKYYLWLDLTELITKPEVRLG